MRWLVLISLTTLGALTGDLAGLPSSALFAGMLAGVGVALLWPGGSSGGAPAPLLRCSEALVGVVLGTFVQLSTFAEIGADLVPILLATLATLGLSVACGRVLARVTELDRATAAFGTIAGGATGIIVMSRELGADQRLVAVLQYLRVVVVVVLTPVVAAVAFGDDGSAGSGGAVAPAQAGAQGGRGPGGRRGPRAAPAARVRRHRRRGRAALHPGEPAQRRPDPRAGAGADRRAAGRLVRPGASPVARDAR